MIDKAYVRFRENLPDNQNTYAAADGFVQQGIPVVPYYGFGDLEKFGDIGPNVIVCGHIGDIRSALTMCGKPIPPNIDYPDHLRWMLGREIKECTLEEVRGLITRKFVKPVQQKQFTGFVWDPDDPRSRLNVAIYESDTPCLVADEIDIISEWRCFIRHHKVVGVKHYKGDWGYAPTLGVLERAVREGRGKMPDAYVLDLGVVREIVPFSEEDRQTTVLIEANEGYAVGSYGLPSIIYARFLEARWDQLMR